MAQKIAEKIKICPSCKGSGLAIKNGEIVDCPTCKGECVVNR